MTDGLPLMERIGKLHKAMNMCGYPGYEFHFTTNYSTITIWASYMEADTVTGISELQETRKWEMPSTCSESEIVSTCFKCVLTSMEHRVREWFVYRDKPIYNPHYDVEKLYSVCDARGTQKEEVHHG